MTAISDGPPQQEGRPLKLKRSSGESLGHGAPIHVLCILLVLAFLAGCGGAQSNTATVAASDNWPAQFALAGQKAHSTDPSAVLWHVLATPAQEPLAAWDPSTDPLRLHFDYLKTDHNQLRVTILDTDPQGTLSVKEVTNPDAALLRPGLRPDE